MKNPKSTVKVGDPVSLSLLFQGPRMKTRRAKVVKVTKKGFDVECSEGKLWRDMVELDGNSPARAVGIRPLVVEEKKKKKKKDERGDAPGAGETTDPNPSGSSTSPPKLA